MSVQPRKAAIALLAEIAGRIDERVGRHTLLEEAGTPSTTTRLTQDFNAFRDRIALVAGELLSAPTAAHITTILDRVSGPDYGLHPHSVKELTALGKKLQWVIEELRIIEKHRDMVD
ncbi:hypothetical protein [Gulosibacter sp. 10]|uniref:hypothetical protein n=1 Tax=Gulosibacter sp. 10 TaxID=1255570 RepID=UPI00097F3E5C|nr:hypothetical protein [Gulosibacter sp. 10]SJM49520.1 hypothetical protein FM112_01115 [Gulosibacter sp. 10]